MDWIQLIRPEKLQQLSINWAKQQKVKGTGQEIDFKPVCKLFNPIGAATWLLTECDDDGLAFGLCDLGFGSPELGYVSLQEIAEVRLPGGLTIEEDLFFEAEMTLSKYAEDARTLGRIKA